MLILILIDFQFSQKVVFSFENGSNNQNHSSGSLHTVKKSPPVKFSIGGGFVPLPFTTIWKTLHFGSFEVYTNNSVSDQLSTLLLFCG